MPIDTDKKLERFLICVYRSSSVAIFSPRFMAGASAMRGSLAARQTESPLAGVVVEHLDGFK